MSVSHMTITLDQYSKYEQHLREMAEKSTERDMERRQIAETSEMREFPAPFLLKH